MFKLYVLWVVQHNCYHLMLHLYTELWSHFWFRFKSNLVHSVLCFQFAVLNSDSVSFTSRSSSALLFCFSFRFAKASSLSSKHVSTSSTLKPSLSKITWKNTWNLKLGCSNICSTSELTSLSINLFSLLIASVSRDVLQK